MARGRAPLIEYLDGLGFALDEMVEAEREGRLYALAGDALIRSGRRSSACGWPLTPSGSNSRPSKHAWASLGSPSRDQMRWALSEADVNALGTWATTRWIFGDDAAIGLLRVLGSSLARIADAQLSAARLVIPETRINYTGDELVTARGVSVHHRVHPCHRRLIDASVPAAT